MGSEMCIRDRVKNLTCKHIGVGRVSGGCLESVWFGFVLFGLVWFGMVWYGLVWFGMVWYGIVSWKLSFAQLSPSLFLFLFGLVELQGIQIVNILQVMVLYILQVIQVKLLHPICTIWLPKEY